jgi:hypothetical protein
MITEKEAEGACDFLRDNASEHAKAKSERIYLMEYRKTVKALQINKCKGTIQEREAFAYAHPDYLVVLDGIREAVREEERLNWIMKAAEGKMELYRTQSANNRMVDRVHR